MQTRTDAGAGSRGRSSGRIDLRLTLLQPFHHGSRSSGNTALLRTKPVVNPETGDRHDVPYLSANSVRHQIRAGAAWHAIRTAGLDDGRLSKGAVHLLLSGGSLTKTGGGVNLKQARRLTELVPGLGLMGFSAGNHMQAGKLLVSDLDLVCGENAWRAPSDVRDDGRCASVFGAWVEDQMSTRRDSMGDASVRALLSAEARNHIDEDVSERLARSESGKINDRGDSLQMIYEHQVVISGAGFWGDIHYRELSGLERAALVSALSWWCLGQHDDDSYIFHFGARASHGWGRARVTFSGVRLTGPAESVEDLRPVAPGSRPPEIVAYEEHLRNCAAEIHEAIEAAT